MRVYSKYIKPPLILFLLLGAWTTFGAAQEKNYKILVVDNNLSKNNFYPYGGYKMFGEKAADFSEFNNFTLEFAELPQNGQPLKLVGAAIFNLTPESSIIYQFDSLTISEREISFSTETKDAIRYEFAGVFLKKGEFTRYNGKKIPVLEGTLKRFKYGAEAAKASARFVFNVWKAPYYQKPRK